jgi:hypothetical protein
MRAPLLDATAARFDVCGLRARKKTLKNGCIASNLTAQ